MAISWLAVLKSVPWSEVIGNAPKIAKGAKQLWDTLRKQSVPVEPSATADQGEKSEAARLNDAEDRVAALEQSLLQMHAQLQSSADLIKSLADQNALLVAQLETMRRRQVWLTIATSVMALVALLAFALMFHTHS